MTFVYEKEVELNDQFIHKILAIAPEVIEDVAPMPRRPYNFMDNFSCGAVNNRISALVSKLVVERKFGVWMVSPSLFDSKQAGQAPPKHRQRLIVFCGPYEPKGSERSWIRVSHEAAVEGAIDLGELGRKREARGIIKACEGEEMKIVIRYRY